MNGIKNILQDTLTVSTSMLEQESKNHQLLENTINRDDQGKIEVQSSLFHRIKKKIPLLVFVTFYNILEFIEKGKDKQADETLKEIATLANQVIMAPIDLHVFNKTLYKQVKDKLERLESKFVSKRPTR
jgi:hypothetical protein